eukprot:11525046-Prorocentrum_lima.AAC.1
MTSSLVGSEMCIRDSACSPPTPGIHVRTLSCTQPFAHAAPSAERGFESVSYTHLTLPTICSV